MKTYNFLFLVALALSTFGSIAAQEINTKTDTIITADRIKELISEREYVINLEKTDLKKRVLEIEEQLVENRITKEEAVTLKMDAAKATAKNIENRTAIIDNRIALLERSENVVAEESDDDFEEDDGRIMGIRYKKNDDDMVYRYDRRTTSALVVALGFNNAIIDGKSLDDTSYRVGGSRFFELGWSWKTRVSENTNWLRFRYGFSFQFNGLKMDDNQYFVEHGDQTVLEEFPLHLKKSKFRMDNLVIPVFFELGPSDRKEYNDHFRFSTYKKFKVGLGAYAGLNLMTLQKLKYKEDGHHRKDKLKQNYNTNNFIYGLAAYVGVGGFSLYAKYDLNTIFRHNPIDQNNISLGLRIDVR